MCDSHVPALQPIYLACHDSISFVALLVGQLEHLEQLQNQAHNSSGRVAQCDGLACQQPLRHEEVHCPRCRACHQCNVQSQTTCCPPTLCAAGPLLLLHDLHRLVTKPLQTVSLATL
jgi:hypothetical protein